ncbi:hypothetical protein G7047_14655 [Diaphorobacter sp. HDW4A]|uniref:hypothetical protein n=1 Tax=Diaphorobacter sp. HDW4A TaxID=2714924 RepID=UPI0014099146|nr:hypothetical protein [Diaphorobacter sp. HDW4A]QIL80998.1 hypothetical protein G7047_14655 [Diaphorobacter sp. HDW4A]
MAVAVQQQNQIDVSINENGQIVISQYLGDDEMTQCNVVVAPVNVDGLIRALRAAKREARKAEE